MLLDTEFMCFKFGTLCLVDHISTVTLSALNLVLLESLFISLSDNVE